MALEIIPDSVLQQVPFSATLIQPSVPLTCLVVELEVQLEVPDTQPHTETFKVAQFPVIALRHSIHERWCKQIPRSSPEEIQEEVEENETAHSTPAEYEEAGYRFYGKDTELEYIYVGRFGHAIATEGGQVWHRHECGLDVGPIVYVRILRVCYHQPDMSSVIEDIKRKATKISQEDDCSDDNGD
jgi:hypothetical protein